MIEIRQVDVSSATELSELCKTSFFDAYKDVHSTEDISAYCEKNYSIPKIIANLSDPDVTYKMSYREGLAVGFLMLQNQVCPVKLDGNVVELKQIYVRASEFGTGLGEQLLTEVLRHARHYNKKWIWLCVSDLNTRAQSFYLKHGFKPVGVAPVLEVGNDRLPASVMTFKIK